VTFASAFDRATSTTYWGTWHGDPAYNQSQSDPHHIAVVILDKAVRGITPAQLPAENSLSNLAGDQKFTSVGYGAQEVANGPGGKTFHYSDIRYVAVGTLNSVPGNDSWLRISQNVSTGNGGTCYGDSGGPNFLGPARARLASSLRRRSRATHRAARPTSTIASTPPPRARSCRTT